MHQTRSKPTCIIELAAAWFGGGEAAANSKIYIFFDTVWSICVFSITVILNNSNSAVDVKIIWILWLLLIRITVFLLFELLLIESDQLKNLLGNPIHESTIWKCKLKLNWMDYLKHQDSLIMIIAKEFMNPFYGRKVLI